MSSFPFGKKKASINWADEDDSSDDEKGDDSTGPDEPDVPSSDSEDEADAAAAAEESEEEQDASDDDDEAESSEEDEPEPEPAPAPEVAPAEDKPKPPPPKQLTKKERKALKAKELDDLDALLAAEGLAPQEAPAAPDLIISPLGDMHTMELGVVM